MKCERNLSCENHPERCLYCSNYEYFKGNKGSGKGLRKTPSSKKKGAGFEDKVLELYKNKIFGRKFLSGAMIDHKSDIETIKTVMECKETDVTGGKKQITIKKSYHDKIEKEGDHQKKYPFLIYGFKENEQYEENDIYFSTRYNYLLNILLELKRMHEQLEQKNKTIKNLKQKIKKLEE